MSDRKFFASLALHRLIGACCLCLLLASCSTFAQDEPTAGPELEAQILQVLRDNPEVIIESVQAYQKQKQAEVSQVRQEFLQQMISEPSKAIGNAPVTGSADRKIVLIEFSDFQCPFCAQAHETVNAFVEKYGDRVTLTYKHLPLEQIHPEAKPAALASWAAQQQGKFWEYHDALFERQENLGEELYVELAQNLSLDLEKFNRDRKSEAAQAAVDADVELATHLGITGTPFFFLNEHALSGAVQLAELEQKLAEIEASKP